MRASKLSSLLDSYANARVYVRIDGGTDQRVHDVSVFNDRVVLFVEPDDDDTMITFDIVGPDDQSLWQIVYSTGVLTHVPIGTPVSDFMIAEAAITALYQNITLFVAAVNSEVGTDYVNKITSAIP